MKGHHEALIDMATWEKTCVLREHRSTVPHKQRATTYPLTGILWCGVCGGRMGAMTRWGKYSSYRWSARPLP